MGYGIRPRLCTGFGDVPASALPKTLQRPKGLLRQMGKMALLHLLSCPSADDWRHTILDRTGINLLENPAGSSPAPVGFFPLFHIFLPLINPRFHFPFKNYSHNYRKKSKSPCYNPAHRRDSFELSPPSFSVII